jgi:hypothetical protein
MAMNQPNFDEQSAHRFFAADCFNRAWDLIQKPARSADENQQMLLLALASLWHWTERDDCTDRSFSIGYWQVSRVYSVLGEGENAQRYAELCMAKSKEEAPFFLGYAHEAMARAAMVRGDHEQMRNHAAEARRLAGHVTNSKDRAALEKDLDSVC